MTNKFYNASLCERIEMFAVEDCHEFTQMAVDWLHQAANGTSRIGELKRILRIIRDKALETIDKELDTRPNKLH